MLKGAGQDYVVNPVLGDRPVDAVHAVIAPLESGGLSPHVEVDDGRTARTEVEGAKTLTPIKISDRVNNPSLNVPSN